MMLEQGNKMGIWLVAALMLVLCGCAGRYLPGVAQPYPAALRSQQALMAGSLDECFNAMDFSKLAGGTAEVEVSGVFFDWSGLGRYLQARTELELAEDGVTVLEPPPSTQYRKVEPDYRVMVLAKSAGSDVIVDNTLLFYTEKRLVCGADLTVAVYETEGGLQLARNYTNSEEATIGRRIWILFFPISLPTTYTESTGVALMDMIRGTTIQTRQYTPEKAEAR